MRRNCNLELRLLPFSATDSVQYPLRHHNSSLNMEESSSTTTSSELSTPKQNQPLTIFYNGRICVCDVTEFQARSILLLASREMEERLKTPRTTTPGSEPCSPSLQSPIYSPTAALSMKRSLQRFLQKRKHRAQAMTPYHR
ncbi:Jasmonate-zim domain protein [Trema orientale]|uniref:Protein TIFY n=1 Tax=Trema orientale TaxID=63057 RepID=A0A2P5EQU0_TREOI|nr:Jasmonate-zim domain protein [Trema orientale]